MSFDQVSTIYSTDRGEYKRKEYKIVATPHKDSEFEFLHYYVPR
jgi:hypothetical protein